MPTVTEWIDNILNDKVIPTNTVAFCFNLYEESDGSWAMELIGTEQFDLDDEDWACRETTDFGSREQLYTVNTDCIIALRFRVCWMRYSRFYR